MYPEPFVKALDIAGINLSPFTEDFSVWGALNDCHLAVSQLLNRKQTESFPAAAKGSKRQSVCSTTLTDAYQMPMLLNAKIILHRILSLVRVTNILSEIRKLQC